MGMYNELNKINQSINQQAIEMKKTQEHSKKIEYVKNELEGILLESLIEQDNIYNNEIKSIVIDVVMHSTDVLLYNKDYTRQFLNKRYYTIARQVEQIKKKQSKYNSCSQEEAAQQPKEAEHTQKHSTFKSDTLIKILIYTIIVILVICFAPVAIVGFLVTGFVGALCRSGKKKKRR